jgi:hypothetical protein
MGGGLDLAVLLRLFVAIIIAINRLLDGEVLLVLLLLGAAFAQREVVQFVVLVPSLG